MKYYNVKENDKSTILLGNTKHGLMQIALPSFISIFLLICVVRLMLLPKSEASEYILVALGVLLFMASAVASGFVIHKNTKGKESIVINENSIALYKGTILEKEILWEDLHFYGKVNDPVNAACFVYFSSVAIDEQEISKYVGEYLHKRFKPIKTIIPKEAIVFFVHSADIEEFYQLALKRIKNKM